MDLSVNHEQKTVFEERLIASPLPAFLEQPVSKAVPIAKDIKNFFMTLNDFVIIYFSLFTTKICLFIIDGG